MFRNLINECVNRNYIINNNNDNVRNSKHLQQPGEIKRKTILKNLKERYGMRCILLNVVWGSLSKAEGGMMDNLINNGESAENIQHTQKIIRTSSGQETKAKKYCRSSHVHVTTRGHRNEFSVVILEIFKTKQKHSKQPVSHCNFVSSNLLRKVKDKTKERL